MSAPVPVPGRVAGVLAGRRAALGVLLLPVLAACSAFQTPFVEPKRFPLLPVRQGPPLAGYGRRTLLVRLARAAPGQEGRLLRSRNPDGTESVEYYAEWTAPPAEAMEDALRRWLLASGLYAGVVAPGTHATPDFTVEVELSELHVDLGRSEARAALAAVLLRETTLATRVLAQSVHVGTSPVPPARPVPPEVQARAMVEALGNALSGLELVLARHAL
ncbi:hypothetical protein [Roseomonas sp. BN140053]|uniref:hypothetical protein n=1 Tax=Roseomonas sp. BN140053 TaxID=3391898 RepID=UPI0039EA6512